MYSFNKIHLKIFIYFIYLFILKIFASCNFAQISFKHPRDVSLIVETARLQLIHNALFESLLHSPIRNVSSSFSNLDVKIYSANVSSFDLTFSIKKNLYIG